LYQNLHEMPGVWSFRLSQFLDDPVLKKGLAKGYELDRWNTLAEGQTPAIPTANPRTAAMDKLKQAYDTVLERARKKNSRTGMVDAGELIKEAGISPAEFDRMMEGAEHNTSGGHSLQLMSSSSSRGRSPAFTEAGRSYYNVKFSEPAGGATSPAPLGVRVDAEGNVELLQTPTMRVLDMAKQGLDAMIADERNDLTGRLSARGVALDRVRRAYLTELDSLDPTGAYRAARSSWQGYSKSLDALRAGRALFSSSPEEIEAEIGRLAEGDKEFYRMGAADILRERIAKTGLGGDEAKAIMKNPWMRDQLKPVFKTQADFDSFVNAVGSESTMFRTRQSMLGGSQTAERVAEDAGGGMLDSPGARLIEQASSGRWYTAVKTALRLYNDVGLRPNPKVNETIARILFSTPIDPQSETTLRLLGQIAGRTNKFEGTAAAIEAGGTPAVPALARAGAAGTASAGTSDEP